MPSIGNLNYRYIGPIVLFHSLVMLVGTIDAIQKTTVTRFVHILAALDRSYWDLNRSDELTTTDPTFAAAGFRYLSPTSTQRASFHTIQKGDSTLELSWVPDLGSLHPVAPIEVNADRWSTTSSLVVPPMNSLAMPAWDKEREVMYHNLRRVTAKNVSLLDSGLQHGQLESV